MNFLRKLSSKFRTKRDEPKYSQLDVVIGDITFLGNAQGNGVTILLQELKEVLSSETMVRQAWLSRIRYSGEPKIRLSIILAGDQLQIPPESLINYCRDNVSSIDIMLMNDFPENVRKIIGEICSVFYESGLSYN